MLPRAKIGAIAPIVSAKRATIPEEARIGGEKIKHSGDETDVAPESGFDVGIQPAGQRDAAPGEREGRDKNRHRQSAKEKGQRRARSELGGDECRQGEDSRAHR